MIPLSYSLLLGSAIFVTGLVGLLLRRNSIVMLMCIEMMINAANINLVAFSNFYGLVGGQSLVIFIIGLEAAELAVALAVVTAYHRARGSIDLDTAGVLKD